MREEPCDRLRKARIRSGFAQAKDAAVYHGWNGNTYKSHENGNRGLSKDAAITYADAFNVSIGWLLTGENPPDWSNDAGTIVQRLPAKRVPVLSFEQAFSLTQGIEIENINDIRDYAVIGVDPMLSSNVFALKIEDEAMAPEIKPGEFIGVDPKAVCKPGDRVAVGLFALKSAIVREYRIEGYGNDGEELVTLKAHNNAYPDLPFINGESGKIIGKVVWHMRKL